MPSGLESAPAWSPDGKTIAYIHGGDPKKIEYAMHSLATIPAAGGEAKILTPEARSQSAPAPFRARWEIDLGRAGDDGASSLVRVLGGGRRAASGGGGRRTVTAYDVSRDGKVIVAPSTLDRPYEIFAVESERLARLTKQNGAPGSRSSSSASRRKPNSRARTAPRCTASW